MHSLTAHVLLAYTILMDEQNYSIDWFIECGRGGGLQQGCIDPPKAGRGHATPVQPVQRAKCWRLLNLEPRF